MSEAGITVVMPGLWMPTAEMLMLRRALQQRHGLPTIAFGYSSVKRDLKANAAALAQFVCELGHPRCHLVGHSLGGVLAMQMLADWPEAPVDRVVCLGSPLGGSRAAQGLAGSGWGQQLLGLSINEGVVGSSAAEWAGEVFERHEVGVIAGTLGVGIGMFFGRFREPNDGTVAVSETRCAGSKDHLCLPVSHTGMVVSRAVARQTASFLKNGTFAHT